MRAPLSLPFLGMSLKERNVVWLLGSPRAASGEYMWIPIRRIQTPPVIHYWGHYPVADLEYTLPDSPVSVGLRAWSPFLPGDSLTSNTPGAVFEVHLLNVSSTTQQGRLAFMFPGPTQAEAQIYLHSPRERRTQPYPHMIALAPTPTRALRQQVRGEEFSGVVVTSEAVKDLGYAIGVIGDMEVHSGGGITPAGNPDAPGKRSLSHRLPARRSLRLRFPQMSGLPAGLCRHRSEPPYRQSLRWRIRGSLTASEVTTTPENSSPPLPRGRCGSKCGAKSFQAWWLPPKPSRTSDTPSE